MPDSPKDWFVAVFATLAFISYISAFIIIFKTFSDAHKELDEDDTI